MIDSKAVIDPSAKIAEDVHIGPFTVIGPNVEIDCGCRIHSNVVIKGPTKIGKNNEIFQFSSVGEDCQDKKYNGEPTKLEIGDNNIIRESCTIHRGTVQDKGITKIGNNNLLMAYVHIAHDVVLADDCIFANYVGLAGHVTVGTGAILGGFTTVHQFCKIAPYSMSGAHAAIFKDIPAFVIVAGNPATPHGMNFEGMRRKNWSKEKIRAMKEAYKIIYMRKNTLDKALELLKEMSVETEEIQLLIDSLIDSKRGITR